MVRIFLYYAAHPPVVGEFLALLLKEQGNTGAASIALARLDGKLGFAVGFPQNTLVSGLAGLAGVNLYPVGHDERGGDRVAPASDRPPTIGLSAFYSHSNRYIQIS